jgi:hypothetical protein
MKNGVLWDVTPCGVVLSSPIIGTLMEALSSSETSVLTRSKRRNIPEGAILHSHRRENLKSYKKYKYYILASSCVCVCVRARAIFAYLAKSRQ